MPALKHVFVGRRTSHAISFESAINAQQDGFCPANRYSRWYISWLKAPKACGAETAQRHAHVWTIETKKIRADCLVGRYMGGGANNRHQSKLPSQGDCGRIDGG